MPFCPQCRDEFEDWVTVCPDCKVPLAAVLEEDKPEVVELEEAHDYLYSNEPLVHVATAPNEAIAGMWAGILENNGIHCLIKGDDFK
jgi:predicted amidophosphoribosyltransferase